jgi:hypothetical protein
MHALLVFCLLSADPAPLPPDLSAAWSEVQAKETAVKAASTAADSANVALGAMTRQLSDAQAKAAQAEADYEAAWAKWEAALDAHRPKPRPTPNPPKPDPPKPDPTPTPGPLRVLFIYDPMTIATYPPAQEAILTAPAIRAYLDGHCPLESQCLTGMCPLNATQGHSYLFLPVGADTSKLPAVWRQTIAALGDKKPPWLAVIDSAGKTVVDQAWPATVDATLSLLKKWGGS